MGDYAKYHCFGFTPDKAQLEPSPYVSAPREHTSNREKPATWKVEKFLTDNHLQINDYFMIYSTTGQVRKSFDPGPYFVNSSYELHKKERKAAGPSKSVLWNLLLGYYKVISPGGEKFPQPKGTTIKINFKGVGQPTDKMISCMQWITSLTPLRQDLLEYTEDIWWDFPAASKFISANIDATREKAYKVRQHLKDVTPGVHTQRYSSSGGYMFGPDPDEAYEEYITYCAINAADDGEHAFGIAMRADRMKSQLSVEDYNAGFRGGFTTGIED